MEIYVGKTQKKHRSSCLKIRISQHRLNFTIHEKFEIAFLKKISKLRLKQIVYFYYLEKSKYFVDNLKIFISIKYGHLF